MSAKMHINPVSNSGFQFFPHTVCCLFIKFYSMDDEETGQPSYNNVWQNRVDNKTPLLWGTNATKKGNISVHHLGHFWDCWKDPTLNWGKWDCWKLQFICNTRFHFYLQVSTVFHPSWPLLRLSSLSLSIPFYWSLLSYYCLNSMVSVLVADKRFLPWKESTCFPKRWVLFTVITECWKRAIVLQSMKTLLYWSSHQHLSRALSAVLLSDTITMNWEYPTNPSSIAIHIVFNKKR